MRTLRRAGYQLVNVQKMYEFDGLHTVHDARFREDQRFQSTYQRALQASHGVDPHKVDLRSFGPNHPKKSKDASRRVEIVVQVS